jgi:hypothetical protein
MTYRYQWLVEVTPSVMTRDAKTVFVFADYCVCEAGTLQFWSGLDNAEYLLCAFAPGQWGKCEIADAISGTGNGMFPATAQGREDYAR